MIWHNKIIAEYAVPMTTTAHALPESCPNCSHPVSCPYCSQCGQKVIIETPTLWEFVHEYLHHYVALDGSLTRTLWMLVRRPGKLTTEFLAGRRARYIKPLQLYLTISFIFFVVYSLVNSGTNERTADIKVGNETVQFRRTPVAPAEIDAPRIGASITKADDETARKTIAIDLSDMARRSVILRPLADRIHKKQDWFKQHGEEASREFEERLSHYTPYGIFALMPAVAFLLSLIYRRRGLRYGAHLVFALHLHAFVFLALLVSELPIGVGIVVPPVICAYMIVALRQAYGGRWVPQIGRSLTLLAGYAVFGMLTTAFVWALAFIL
jgi:hypothetical protein